MREGTSGALTPRKESLLLEPTILWRHLHVKDVLALSWPNIHLNNKSLGYTPHGPRYSSRRLHFEERGSINVP